MEKKTEIGKINVKEKGKSSAQNNSDGVIHCPINNAVLVNTCQKRKARGGFDWSATGLKEKKMT